MDRAGYQPAAVRAAAASAVSDLVLRHAYHAGRRASVSADGDVLAGSLESRALQFVREWAVLRHDEILANWERARRNEPLLGIDPLA